jgi:hypothetical protein
MDANLRLRLATRIHFALLRRYGEDVPVVDLLSGTGQAQDALWVCEASDDPDLRTLAARFQSATPGSTQAMPLDSTWAASTGFGVTGGTQFGELVAVPPGAVTVHGGLARR